VETGADVGAQPDDVARVRGDLRLNQHDFEHRIIVPRDATGAMSRVFV
jgi:hypothetical protein